MKRTLLAIIIFILLTTGALPPMETSFAFSSAIEPTENEKPTLLTQSLIEREISGGQSHLYSIDLAAGQFLQVDIQQLGIDVVVSLIDPDGQPKIESNSPDLSYGDEPLYWIAEKSGKYQVVVKAAEKNAKISKYTIKINEVRASTDQDVHYLNGQQKLAEGERLRFQGKKETFLSALEAYKKSIEYWQLAGEKEREGVALNLIALVTYYFGDTSKAIEYFVQASSLRSRGGKAQSVSNLGAMYIITGEKSKALDSFSQGLELSREVGDKITQSNSLNGIGNLYYSFGNNQTALNYYSQALIVSREIGDRSREASALHNIGTVFTTVNDYEKAISYFTETLPIWDEINDIYNKIYTLNYIGHVYRGLQLYDIALNYYNQVLEISSVKGQKRDQAVTLVRIAQIYYLLRDYDKALENCTKALDLSLSSVDLTNQATAYNVLGAIYSALGQQEKALEFFNKSLEIAKSLSQQALQADTYYNIARSYSNLGNFTLATENVKKAIAIIETTRSRILNQELKTYYFAGVQDYYDFYCDLLMKQHEKDPSLGYNAEAFRVNELSQARTLLEVVKEGQINIREGVDNLLVNREIEIKRSLSSKTEILIRMLNKANDNLEERAKIEREIHLLDTDLEQVQSKIRETSPRYAAIKQPKPLTLQEIQKDVLDSDTILLEYSLGKDVSYLWMVTDSSITSYKLPNKYEIEKAANPVIKYFTSYFHPENESQEQRKENLAKEEVFVKLANDFSQIILGPVASQLGKKRLLIVGDGILRYMPFAGLPAPNRDKTTNQLYPLVVDHEIISMPSASTVGVLRKEFNGRKPAPNSIFVLADPVFTNDDDRLAINSNKKVDSKETIVKVSNRIEKKTEITLVRTAIERSNPTRLVFSAQEAKRILEIYADESPKIVLGLNADLSTATSEELSKYRIIHFATHGFINSLQPELSGIVLSLFDDNGREQSGYLTANHIFNLKLNADLVVLSACQTGAGREIRGEGVLGLTRGFLYAGAERVMFSLWNVNDESTSIFMSKFYTSMKKEKLTPSASLRQAQIAMWKDKKWNVPYYWAAFQLQGEWRAK